MEKTAVTENTMDLYEYEKKHLQGLRPYLTECTVLLKSDGAFPLSGPCKVALYGNGARNTVKGGRGSGEVNSRYFVNVEQALESEGFDILTKSALDEYDAVRANARKEFVRNIKAEARAHHQMAVTYAMGTVMKEPEYEIPLNYEADCALFILARDSGEGTDRKAEKGDVYLTDSEKRDILALNRGYKSFMLVLNTGGPVDLSGLEEVKNILVLSQLGVETGCALCDIILGRENPSGKLATTWAAYEDYSRIGDFGDNNDTNYKEGIYVGYRYFDSVGEKALFPFGFGLSFTTFKADVQPVELKGSTVTVKTDVTNTGKRAGKEVVQVYVSCPQGKLDKSYQDLAGFAKTSLLKPGKKETVEVSFDLKDLASFDEEKAQFILEKGKYIIRTGNSSVATVPVAVIDLDKDAVVLKAKTCFTKPSFEDWKPEKAIETEIPSFVPVLALKAEDIKTSKVDYKATYPIDEAVKKLSDRQLVLANIGTFKEKGGVLSVIGSASAKVAGAAGEVSSALTDAGFKTMVLADGPAGLRLSTKYYRDAKGAHGVGAASHSESFMEFMPKIVLWAMKVAGGNNKVPKGCKVQDQYCTAIPIGTAIAQSWNTDLAKYCGDIIGAEMEMFDVQLWLAPALNIHRSILCGRNFEYYSEDPLISGKMASAITLGVQAHKGCGTTIKHYAANNQERNRYGNSSNVSERALREIYLKGFGICVRESQPKAVMTSYNLINGLHTAQNRELIENILRREFGFEGIVMTDWVVGDGFMNGKNDIHPRVSQSLTAAAGGDLFMPGCNKDYEKMMKGLETGEVTKEQLQINATRVYRMGLELSDGKA